LLKYHTAASCLAQVSHSSLLSCSSITQQPAVFLKYNTAACGLAQVSHSSLLSCSSITYQPIVLLKYHTAAYCLAQVSHSSLLSCSSITTMALPQRILRHLKLQVGINHGHLLPTGTAANIAARSTQGTATAPPRPAAQDPVRPYTSNYTMSYRFSWQACQIF
jgi:hypothetical protein